MAVTETTTIELTEPQKRAVRKYMLALCVPASILSAIIGYLVKDGLDKTTHAAVAEKALEIIIPMNQAVSSAKANVEASAREVDRLLDSVRLSTQETSTMKLQLEGVSSLAKGNTDEIISGLQTAILTNAAFKKDILVTLANDYVRVGDTIGLRTRANAYIGANDGLGLINTGNTGDRRGFGRDEEFAVVKK